MDFNKIIKEHPEYLLNDFSNIFNNHTALANLIVAAKCETCFEEDIEAVYTDEVLSNIFTSFGESPWKAIYVQAVMYLDTETIKEAKKDPNDFNFN